MSELREKIQWRVLLENHLLYNCYPPAPDHIFDRAIKYLEWWNENGDHSCVLARFFDDWQLWDFVEE